MQCCAGWPETTIKRVAEQFGLRATTLCVQMLLDKVSGNEEILGQIKCESSILIGGLLMSNVVGSYREQANQTNAVGDVTKLYTKTKCVEQKVIEDAHTRSYAKNNYKTTKPRHREHTTRLDTPNTETSCSTSTRVP